MTDLASDGDADDQYITLTISAGVSGTGAMSYVYSNTLGDITDASAQANVLADIGSTLADDGAAPIVLNAITLDDGDGDVDALELEFSEPMNDASLSSNFSDWTLNDGTNGPAAFTGFSSQTDVVSGGTVNTANDQYATLTISTGVVGTGIMDYAYGGVAITDNSTQTVALATITATAADDDAAPTITGYTLEGSNSYLDVDFSENVYGSDGITETVKADWTLTFDQNVGGGGTATAAEIGDITTTGDVVIPTNSGVSTVRFNLIFTGNQSGDELIAISPVDGSSVADVSPAINLMSGAQTTGNISVNTVTAVIFDVSSSANADNTAINLVFSEGVGRNTGGSGALRYNDAGCNPGGGIDELCAEFVDPDGLLTETFAFNAVTHSGGNAFLTFSFSLDGDADGNEYIRFRPADGNEIRGTTNGNMQASHFIDVPLSDEVPPTFTSATYYDHDENGYIDEVVIVMSEPIDDATIDPNDFNIGGTAATGIVTGASIQNGTDNNTADDNTFTLSANTQGTGGLTIAYAEDAAGTALADATGNAAADNAGITATDLAAPVILSAVTRDADTNGEIEKIEVTLTEDVDFTTLDAGGADFTVTSPAFVITAAAQNGSNGVDLTLTPSGSTDVDETPTVTLLTGAIADGDANTTADGDFSITTADGANPYFATLAVNDPNGYINGELMTLDINMGETGLTVTVNLQNLNAALSASQALADDGDGTYSYSLFVSDAMTEAEDIVLPITATDGAANSLVNSTLTVDLDFTAPTVDITPIFTSDLSPALAGNVGDATATVEVEINGGGPYTATNAGSTWSLAQGTITPDLTTNTTYSVTVTATDPAGNATIDATNGEVKIDNTAPTITSINRSNPLVSTTNASTVVFRVTFDEGVKDVDAGDFDISAFTATNTADAPVVSHISGGSVYDITINNISGSGTLALDVSGATITDSLTVSPNAFAGTVGVSQSYEIDQTEPTVLSIVRKDANPTSAATVNFRATFSEPVTNVTADGSDFDVNTSGPTIGAVAVTQISSSIYDISVAVSGASGDVFIESNGGQDIADLYGNSWDDTTVPSETYNIDYTAPSEDASSVSVIGQEATLSVDLNEAGTVYYVVLLSGDAAPAAAEDIRDLTNNAASPEASGNLSIPSGASAHETSINLPDPKTGYVVYLALEDLASPNKNITAGSVLPVTSGGVTLAAGSLPSDLCLEGPSKTLSDITITEGINNDFRTGTGLTMRLNLPSGFEYDQTATVTTTGSTLNDISAVSFSYPASNTIQITYTVSSTTGADELVISGIEVQAVGSTAYASANIERGGGNAVIFGAEGTDNPVFGSVSSVVRPSATSVQYGGSTVTNFRITPGKAFSITAIGGAAGGTYNWYDDDGSLPITGATVTNTDLNALTGFDGTTPDVYRLYSSTTDPAGCESDLTEFIIGVLEFTNSANTVSFTEDSDPATLTMTEPSGWDGTFYGAGLGATTSSSNVASVVFNPELAGADGSPHTISYELTDGSVTFEFDTLFTVSSSTSGFLVVAGTQGVGEVSFSTVDYCDNGSSVTFDIRQTTLDDIDAAGFYFTRLVGTGISQPAGYVDESGGGSNVIQHATSTGWSYDPNGLTANDYPIRLLGKPKNQLTSTTESVLGNVEFTVYPEPTAALLNISTFYCEDDDVFTIQGGTNDVINGTQTGDITTGYILQKFDGSVFQNYHDFTGGSNDFDPSDPDGDANTAEDETGTYRIVWTTEELTPGNCTSTVTSSSFEIRTKESAPVLDLTSSNTDGLPLSDFGGFDGSEYVFEFCSGTEVPDIKINTTSSPSDVNFALANNTYSWYQSGVGIADGNKVFSTFDAKELFGGTNSPTGNIETDFYVTRTVNSCESDSVMITIRVYADQSQPDIDDTDVSIFASGQDYIFEYCGEPSATISYAALDIISDLEDPSDRAYVEDRSYFRIYDNTAMNEIDQISQGESFTILLDGGLIGATTTASAAFSGTVTTEFYISKVVADSSFLDGSAPFAGCESALTKITANIHTYPDVLDVYDLDASYDNADVATYYMCSGDILNNIQTPGASGTTYNWYLDDGSGTQPDYGAPVTVDGNDGRIATQTNLETAGGYDFDTPDTYEFWVTQTTDKNLGTGFTGCEGDPLKVEVVSYPDPDVITFDANTLRTYEISFCEGDLSGESFPITASNDALFKYYISNPSANKASAATTLFAGDIDADGMVQISTEDLLLQNATQTGGFDDGDNSVGTYYYLISQTNNIDPDGAVDDLGESFEGCESEVSDMAYLAVHVYNIPNAPTTSSGDKLFGEDEVDASGITVTGEGNAGEVFNWYEDLDEDDEPDGAAIFQGAVATSADLNLAGTLGNDRYKFLVTQTQDIDGSVTGFAGCESDYLEIYVFEVPPATTFTQPDPLCEEDAISGFADISYAGEARNTGLSNGVGLSVFRWYDEDGVLQDESTAISNPELTNIKSIDLEDFVLSGFAGGGITSGIDTTIYFSQVLFKDATINSEVFAGTESELISITLTAYPQPLAPALDGDGGDENEYNFCEGIALADLSSAENTISVDVINSGAQYVWYFDSNLSNAIDTANSISLAQLNDETLDGEYFNISTDIEFENVYSIYVTEVNSIIGGFEGCEGEAKEILIYIQPKAEDYQFFDVDLDEDVDDGDAYCYDYGTFTIGTDIVVDGADDFNADGVFSINTGGLVDNGDGTATLTTQDMAAAVGETREGTSSTHTISFTYTSEWGCEETFSQTMVIDAHPTLDITYVGSVGQNNAEDQLDNSLVCYDQGIFTIRGKQESNNATAGDFYLIYLSDTLNGSGFNSIGDGTARMTPALIMEGIGETNSEGNPVEFEVSYVYTDVNSCSNSISQTFTIEPQPTLDIQYETAVVGFSDIGDALEGSIVCYDEGTITIGGEVSYLSGTVLDITQSGDADSVQFTINTGGLTDNGNGTATITLSTAAVSAAGNTNGSEDGLPTSHIVTLFYTDANGCDNEVEHSFTINPLPRLDIQVPDNSPCFDDDVMTLQGRQESGAAQGLTPASSGSFSIYSDEALTTPLTTSGFVDNGDGTASFDPDVIAIDYFSLTYDEVRTGDVATVYIQFDYTDAAGTSCSNTSETTIISIQPQPNISFRVEQNSSVVLSENLADDRYYVSATGSTLLLAGWDLDANAGTGAPLADGTFSGGSIGATQNGETDFDPNGTGAKTDIYTAPEDFAVSYSYTDGQSCDNTVSKTITVLPVPQFQDLGDGENIINVQACLTQEIKQKVVISNLDALGITIDDLNFTWRAGQEAEYDSLEKRFPDYVKITTIAPDTALIEIENAQVSPLNDQLNDGYPKLEGNVTFTVTAQYDFETGIAAQGTISPFAISASRVINIGDTPIPRFRWVNTTVGNTTTFIMDDLNDSPVDINDIKFEVFTMDDLVTPQATIIKQDGVDGVTVDNIKEDWSYNFGQPGDYLVRVTYNSTSSCEAVEERIVTISGIITVDAGGVYTEEFESGFGGWYLDSVDYVTDDSRVKEGFEAYGEFSDAPPSWELGTTADFGSLNETTFWVTDADSSYHKNENSFVYSPAYDFSQMSLPTLAFMFACDMDLRDGVVFQYSTDDGLTWSPLGTYDGDEGATGKNWFNTIGINGDPGSIDAEIIGSVAFNEEAYGWNNQGGVPDADDEEEVVWREAAHKLDAIDRTGPVRFRFALGSTAGDKTVGTDGYLAGFAFDDFQIYDRTKLIVVEQFASLGTQASEAVQDTLNSRLDDELRSDALLINYFTDLGSSIDVLNSRNTKDPGARSLYYGVSNSPKSVITGQVQENDDSDPVGWNINKFNAVALDEPQFTIGNITIGGDEQHVDISIDSFTSNVDIDSANSELSFRVAIVEKTVAGDLVGEDASMVYRNVLRKMLPSAGGKTYVGAVNEGQTAFGELTFDYSWPISKVFDPNNLAVIVFVQLDKDIDETKGLTRGAILQAKMVDVGNGKIVPDASNITSVLPGKEFSIYPNPSDREFEVELAGVALEEMQWVLYDQAGRQVLSGDIEMGESRKLISAESLPSGIFMLHIFNEHTRWSPKRVIVVH
ncbi:MAG: T9SS type A sorting domain-containing protein [Cyclobacteriaceae bacterium]